MSGAASSSHSSSRARRPLMPLMLYVAIFTMHRPAACCFLVLYGRSRSLRQAHATEARQTQCRTSNVDAERQPEYVDFDPLLGRNRGTEQAEQRDLDAGA